MPSVYCNFINDVVWEKQNNNDFELQGIDLWLTDISSNIKLIDQFNHLLSPDEIFQSKRFHQKKDQQRFIINRIALRKLISEYAKQKPEEIQFAKNENKKPYILNSPVPLFFNISHSANLILVAISNSQVGCDIEKVDENFSYQEIVKENFSNCEINFINEAKQPVRNFFLLWTRKEALLKATSKGITDHLSETNFLDGENNMPGEIIGSDEDWKVSSFRVDKNYIGSLGYKNENSKIRMFSADDLSAL